MKKVNKSKNNYAKNPQTKAARHITTTAVTFVILKYKNGIEGFQRPANDFKNITKEKSVTASYMYGYLPTKPASERLKAFYSDNVDD